MSYFEHNKQCLQHSTLAEQDRVREFLTGIPFVRKDHAIRECERQRWDSFDEEVLRHPSLSGDQSSTELDVASIIDRAIRSDASDIHLEPCRDRLRVRIRVDGKLRPAGSGPVNQCCAVAARIKVRAGLDIAEQRRPQDGRIHYEFERRSVDLRVSIMPTQWGEKIVLRILDSGQKRFSLNRLGLNTPQLNAVTNTLSRTRGFLICTGPTGSGKSTTLYSMLDRLAMRNLNVCTLEDPVEYNIPGVNQSGIRNDIGYTFARSLRSVLRQDPDVVMVGEIRDVETARIATRAALTGHLVLSTLHTNDSISTVIRLVDMGVEPYLIASALSLVIAQRLVRRPCTACWSRATGCKRCEGTGYRGRAAIFETMPIDETFREVIGSAPSLTRLRRVFKEKGLKTLCESGRELVDANVTTADELDGLMIPA